MRQCAGAPEFNFLNTEVVGVVGSDEFHWSTKVLITTPYSARSGGILASAIYDDQLYIRVLQIAVEWRAIVSPNQEFTDLA
jgi:hypothetical protein